MRIGVGLSLPGIAARRFSPGAVVPGITPLPSGAVVMWDPASLSLADGATVTSWTDKLGNSVASSTGGSTPCIYVANSGGLPAIRVQGGDVLATTGTNLANTTMASPNNEKTMIVIARNFLDKPAGSSNPVLASSGTGTEVLFEGDTTSTGFFGRLVPCADAGMRSIAFCSSFAKQYGNANYCADGINGTTLNAGTTGNATLGQIAIGGWQNAQSGNTGRCDILAIIIWNRALTAAEFKQVHRRYCDMLGQAYPGGVNAKTFSTVGDSLAAGQGVTRAQAWPYTLAQSLNLPWGTWDNLAIGGNTWQAIRDNQIAMLGNTSAVTGGKSVVATFEWANERGSPGATVAAHAREVIDLLHSQDSNRDVVFGTSTDDGSTTGVATRQNRIDYNAYWDTAGNRSGIQGYVQLHLDPNIGVIGAAPTNGAASTYYQSDGIHNTAAGYALIDNGPYGFRSAVQARLAS